MVAVMFITHTLFMNDFSRTWPKVEDERQKLFQVLFTICTRRMVPCGKRSLRSVKWLSWARAGGNWLRIPEFPLAPMSHPAGDAVWKRWEAGCRRARGVVSIPGAAPVRL